MKVGAGLPGATQNPSQTNTYPRLGTPPVVPGPHAAAGATIASPNLNFAEFGPREERQDGRVPWAKTRAAAALIGRAETMFQQYATGPNSSQMWVLDMLPDENNSAEPNGPRWRPGDPPLLPQKMLMDYDAGCAACERSPLRYRAVGMSDEDYGELVKRAGLPR